MIEAGVISPTDMERQDPSTSPRNIEQADVPSIPPYTPAEDHLEGAPVSPFAQQQQQQQQAIDGASIIKDAHGGKRMLPQRRGRGQRMDSLKQTREGQELVGMRVHVWWALDKCFYQGVIERSDALRSGKFSYDVKYDDGDFEAGVLFTEYNEVRKDGQEFVQVQRTHGGQQRRGVDSEAPKAESNDSDEDEPIFSLAQKKEDGPGRGGTAQEEEEVDEKSGAEAAVDRSRGKGRGGGSGLKFGRRKGSGRLVPSCDEASTKAVDENPVAPASARERGRKRKTGGGSNAAVSVSAEQVPPKQGRSIGGGEPATTTEASEPQEQHAGGEEQNDEGAQVGGSDDNEALADVELGFCAASEPRKRGRPSKQQVRPGLYLGPLLVASKGVTLLPARYLVLLLR